MLYRQSTEEHAIYIAPVEDNNLLHRAAIQAVSKAFHNGPLLSAGPAHTHSHSAGKKPTVFGRPGGDGAGHANDPSLDIWGEGGGWLLGQLAGSFSDLNGSDSTHTKNV